MRGFLLDTNIVSELRRAVPNGQIDKLFTTQLEEHLYFSEVGFAEIRYGIERLDDVGKRADLIGWLENSLRPKFAGRCLPVSEDVILRWRIMLEAGRRRGHTFGQPDLFIAALGSVHDLVCVTRDVDHFVLAGVPVLDPWTGRYYTRGEERMCDLSLDEPGLLDRLASIA